MLFAFTGQVNLRPYKMKRALLYLVSGTMIIAWSVLYLGYNRGGFLHVLLGLGILLFVIGVLRGSRAD